jgi:hypothetical protein
MEKATLYSTQASYLATIVTAALKIRLLARSAGSECGVYEDVKNKLGTNHVGNPHNYSS